MARPATALALLSGAIAKLGTSSSKFQSAGTANWQAFCLSLTIFQPAGTSCAIVRKLAANPIVSSLIAISYFELC
jgi:hypothetical protein